MEVDLTGPRHGNAKLSRRAEEFPVSTYYEMEVLRRAMDIAGAFAGLVVFFPLIALCALIVSLDGANPFFRHRRVGRGMVSFSVFKIRTMRPDSGEVLEKILAEDPIARDQWFRDRKLSPDPRVTPVGRVLRATSIDELPQLLNVLRGEMSLVGPRPVPRDELLLYGRSARFYCRVKPGLTGMWQVSGRNAVSYRRRVALDRVYVIRRSVARDVGIIFATVWEVLRVGGR
jgi:exopolysaccharide production protein ExoY